MMRKGVLLSMASILFAGAAVGQEVLQTDTLGVEVYYRQGYSTLDPALRGNGSRLKTFASDLETLRQDTSCRVRLVRIVSGTSPEGTTTANKRLAKNRSTRVRNYLDLHIPFWRGIPVETTSSGEDWEGLTALVSASDMPYRDEVLDILRNTPVWVVRDGKVVDGRKRRLGMLRGGRPWRYMEDHFFPELRRSKVTVVYEYEQFPAVEPETVPTEPEPIEKSEEAAEPVAGPATVVTESSQPLPRKPFYMALKTNLLYDVALVPNLGAEFYVGRGWSVGGNWMYAWWKSDRRHNYWRTYGGELEIRKYFGRRAKEKPLTGHHLGVYGQMLTYDFETGGKGYMGGRPGGTLWDKMHWGAGLEYGYSLPVGRRLSLDFGIGIGYLGGEYREYVPVDDHYVWSATKQRHWFGPTKAEVSLVWLIGRGNYNEKKGGKR